VSKADYVRQAMRKGRAGGHHCHWPNCERHVQPAAWGCNEHWWRLPNTIRLRIWRAFRPGQEKSKTPSAEYIAAAREAQDWIAANAAPEPPKPKQGALDL
jgi:hypothetical protein